MKTHSLQFRPILAFFALLFAVSLASCKKNPAPVYLPNVTTDLVQNITDVTAEVKATLISDGGEPLAESGICWSTTNQNPTIADTKSNAGLPNGSFTLTITGFSPATTYYVRAYATNSKGTHYGEVKSFTTLVKDASGNLYHTVKIGTQTWMVENLKTTKFNDGSVITDASFSGWVGISTPAFAWYNADPALGSSYGALYNRYALTDPKGIAPEGWHIPTDQDWQVLSDFLGGDDIAGNKLKESGTTHWLDPNLGTNSVGFTALPGGYRDDTGTYSNIITAGYWWSASGDNMVALNSGTSAIIKGTFNSNCGLSVRCVKDL